MIVVVGEEKVIQLIKTTILLILSGSILEWNR